MKIDRARNIARLIRRIVPVLLISVLTSCTWSRPNTILRLSGSNTIGSELAPALVEGYLTKKGAKNIKRIPSSDPEEMSIEAVMPDGAVVKIQIKAHGSETGVKDLENEECDIGMLSRRLKNDEVTRLAKFGDLRAPGSENTTAMDGIAIIMNRSNASIRELSTEKIAQIFSTEDMDWSAVTTKKSGKINVYARDDKSGTYQMFKELVLGNKKLVSTAQTFEDSKLLAAGVSSDPNGIGFVSSAYAKDVTAVAVYEEGGTDPVRPTTITINQRLYLLRRELYFYLPQKNPNNAAKELIDFAKSDAGQEIVKEVNFVSQKIALPGSTPTPIPQATPQQGIPDELAQIRARYTEFPTRFYFRTGKDDLDNKSLDDLERIARFLETQGAKEIILVGFSDATGSKDLNQKLSEQRARTVEKEFVSIGVKPSSVRGFGQAALVDRRNTDEAQARNRRVEVYYK